MSLRTRLMLASVALLGVGLMLMARLVLGDVRPHVFAATEDSLVETAVILASLLEAQPPGPLTTDPLRAAVDVSRHRALGAQIYDVKKDAFDLRVLVTDARGIVLYDSDGGRDEGRDYSAWRDVHRALAGGYGSRATRRDRWDPFSSVFYVAVPVRRGGAVAGVVSVGKQAADVKLFVAGLNRKIAIAGLVALALTAILSVFFAGWVSRPIQQLAAHARSVGEGQRPALPPLATREVAELGRAFEQMRDALDGRRDVEGYVRSLTHETKAPISAIRASAELLSEGLPDADAARFLGNIRNEADRLQQLVDRILELSALEARRSLEPVSVDLWTVASEVASSAAPLVAQKDQTLDVRFEHVPRVSGDPLLLRQALMNLVHNAVRWTPPGGRIVLEGRAEGGRVELAVSDSGPGIADYALPRAFEKFYSVAPPGESRGTGLGLPFVREVAVLHGGQAAVANRPEGGARAAFTVRA